MQDIKDLDLKELESVFKGWNLAAFRARQVFSWVYKKGVTDFQRMSNLPADLRKRLQGNFYISGLKIVRDLRSEDGTEKLLFALPDENFVEAVNIPASGRLTACLSSQVGCKFSCTFCASGLLGFKRNLACGEIIEELYHLKNSAKGHRITNIVFMGTGEPLDNYDNVLKAIRIINSKYSFNIGARRITISTNGITPGIKKLAEESLQVELSVSLHAADEETRSSLMPINKLYPLRELIEACRQYIKRTNRQVTFEYVLIKGINSDFTSAQKLGTILRGLNCKVNLILFNPIEGLDINPPNRQETHLFKDCLVNSGVHVTLRKSRGQDIEAACGQLRLRHVKK
jgi:23S rRNA (adenine2503-C2)-methyltransferase